MTLLQIAIEHCANWEDADGHCARIIIRDDGSLVKHSCLPPICVFKTGGGRCRYFEECILPMEKRKEWPGPSGKAASYAAEFAEACRQYRLGNNISKGSSRLCPGCRRPLEPRARLCPVCREQAEREARKRYKLKKGV